MRAQSLQRKLDAARCQRLRAGMARIRASLGDQVDPTKHHLFVKLWTEGIAKTYGGIAPTA